LLTGSMISASTKQQSRPAQRVREAIIVKSAIRPSCASVRFNANARCLDYPVSRLRSRSELMAEEEVESLRSSRGVEGELRGSDDDQLGCLNFDAIVLDTSTIRGGARWQGLPVVWTTGKPPRLVGSERSPALLITPPPPKSTGATGLFLFPRASD